MKFTIPGEPTGKGRPRVMRTGHAYTPEKTVLYENLVKLCYKGKIHEGELAMDVKAFYQIPKSASRRNADLMQRWCIKPTKKPDCDNVLKIIADALNGIAYKDDSQIVDARVRKYYSDEPRIEVEISEI